MNKRFQNAYRSATAKLRYALMEAMSGPTRTQEQKAANEAAIIKLRRMKANKFAIGSRLGKGAFNHWLVEQLSGLNVNVRYLHTEHMLIEPLGANPLWFAAPRTSVRLLRRMMMFMLIIEAIRVPPIFIVANSCVFTGTSPFATGLPNTRKPTK